MKRILLAPNSFKECSSSVAVAEILRNILVKYGGLNIEKAPISDGGDGFLDVCQDRFNLQMLTFEVTKPYSNELMKARVGFDDKHKKLYIESAEVIGLKMIPEEKRQPSLLNSKGLGELIKLVIESGLNVDKVIMGVGGTGTSDLGLGFCSALGLKLYDIFEREVNIVPENYHSVTGFDRPNVEVPFQMAVIVDVDNPLLGENGAVRMFSGQKGATKIELEALELGFERLVNLFIKKKLINSSESLSGAGGGLAAGLQVFFNASIIQSREFISSALSDKIKSFAPDFILTGEGSFDNQSLLNKGAKTVIDIGVYHNIPVFLVCGRIDKDAIRGYSDGVIPIELQTFFGSKQESIENFHKGLEFAGEKIINHISGH